MAKRTDFLCVDCHDLLLQDELLGKNQRKTFWVVILTSVMMVIEIFAGFVTGSMALLADGWHMASHAGALFIALMAYKFARSPRMNSRFTFGAGKFIPLGGYTSAIILALIAVLMTTESVRRLLSPQTINFDEAIGIAVVGLLVNIVSALILRHEHEHHDHSHVHDHNIRSAFLHVIADGVTSVLAISALVLGKYYHLLWLDAAVGIVGSGVILSWAFQLCRDTGIELLDGHAKSIDRQALSRLIEHDGVQLIDFHAWRIAPQAIACELIVAAPHMRGADYYRKLLKSKFHIRHSVIEEKQL